MLALAVLGVATIPAGAADAPSAKFCAAYDEDLGREREQREHAQPQGRGGARAKFKAAAKQAPAKVKAAVEHHHERPAHDRPHRPVGRR